jgi:biopolymer transport protein ExbB/TolQ
MLIFADETYALKTMKQTIRLLFLTVLLLTGIQVPIAATTPTPTVDSLYTTLDSLLDHQSVIIAQKQQRIRTYQEGLQRLRLTPEQRFHVNNQLYDEYLAFNFDSALYYIRQNVEGPQMLHHPDSIAASMIRMAHILAVSGLFDKASQMLQRIPLRQLSVDNQVAYYNQCAELSLYRSEMAEHSPFYQDYMDSLLHHRDQILQLAPRGSYDDVFNRATQLGERGKIDEGIRLLEDLLRRYRQGDRHYSIITSTLAYFYAKKKVPEQQEYYYLLSAISDVRGAILENNSLRELACILMERGDFERAYAYLLAASKDAQLYGSRLRSMQTARLSPLITQAYDLQREQAQRRTSILLTVLSVITLLLLVTIIYTLSLIKKRRIANERISKMNEELMQHNQEIQSMNTQMKESNRIKDEYIGRFLELSSNLIERGEERNRQLNRLARDRKLEELYAQLKSATFTNEGVRLFYQNFDTAFLNIYPDFITEINKLMLPGEQFDMGDRSDRLTTELRVLALIRLNITDNQKIADILRSSLSTIYTYRSKLKARALAKDRFEDDVRMISTY